MTSCANAGCIFRPVIATPDDLLLVLSVEFCFIFLWPNALGRYTGVGRRRRLSDTDQKSDDPHHDRRTTSALSVGEHLRKKRPKHNRRVVDRVIRAAEPRVMLPKHRFDSLWRQYLGKWQFLTTEKSISNHLCILLMPTRTNRYRSHEKTLHGRLMQVTTMKGIPDFGHGGPKSVNFLQFDEPFTKILALPLDRFCPKLI